MGNTLCKNRVDTTSSADNKGTLDRVIQRCTKVRMGFYGTYCM